MSVKNKRKGRFFSKILFGFIFILTSFVFIKGILIYAKSRIEVDLSGIGSRIVRAIYLDSITEHNQFCDYVLTNRYTANDMVAYLAEGFSINRYMLLESAWIKQDASIEHELEFDYEYAENTDEESRHYVPIGTELKEQMMEENQAYAENEKPREQLEIVFKEGKVQAIENYDSSSTMKDFVLEAKNQVAVSVSNLIGSQYSLEQLKQLDYLIGNYYIVDASTKATKELFDVERLLSMNLTIDRNEKEPQILIYHTHATESYSNSRPGEWKDTVVGAGAYLAELLREYGYQVIHDKTQYDMKDGKGNRNYAYSTALPAIEKTLKNNPGIQVVIDLHRDYGEKRATIINNKPTAQIMLFNGLSQDKNGKIARLYNENLTTNLAFSLQTNLVGRSLFPNLMFRNYLKNYRYNQHLMGRYLLVELGTSKNTVEEAYNAMEPFAVVLDQVLSNP